jgi:hypothetical protein
LRLIYRLRAQGSGKIFEYVVERFCLSPEP